MKQNNKEGKKLYANYYIGISVAFGLIIGVVIGTYLQKKYDNKT